MEVSDSTMGISIKYYKMLLLFFNVSIICIPSVARNEVKELRCEYLVNPIGIDVVQPRLSWKIISDEKNVLQTAYLLAVAFDLLPPKSTKHAVDYLASYIESVGHFTTGFVGTPLLCKTLSENGRADLAFNLLMRKEYPSWLYPVTKGATTIWERWDGIRPDGSFQNQAMNSFNHYSYGSIGEWLYQYIAGICPDELQPGYRHIFLSPHPGGGLTWAKAEFESVYGKIVSEWKLENGKMIYQVEIPPNTSATIILPMTKPGLVKMNGKNVEMNSGNRIEITSGKYQTEFGY